MYGGAPPTHLMWSSMFRPDKPQVRKPVQWSRIAALFVPYWRKEMLVVCCIAVSAVLGLVPPFLTMQVIDKAIPQANVHLLALLVAGMVAAALVQALIGVAQGYLNALVAESILRDLRTQLYCHMHLLPLSFFTGTKTGEVMNRVSNDVDNIDDVISGTLVTILTNFFMLVSTGIAIFALHWRLALLAVAVVPLLIYPLFPVGRRMYEIRKATRKQRDHVEGLNQETLSISGVILLKSFVREQYERRRFLSAADELMQKEVQLAMVGRWFMGVITAMVVIGPAIVWLAGGFLAIQHGITVGAVVTFVALLGRLYTPASTLAGVQVQIVSALAVFERIFEYLDMPEEAAVQTGEIAVGREFCPSAGQVEFDRVCFAYEPGRTVLQDISFTVEPGQVAALVGPSGAGKTTITHLLERFYKAQSGRILIDGQDISELSLQSLRSHIGIVTQETYLFHDTIANNLRYGKLDATQAELAEAARAANILDFIEGLPDKFDTVVGERGHKLSGGERQRLSIARVLLKDPRILILDEATSSLDSVNEALIQSALVPLMQGRTSLVIAHRLSTIVSADLIVVIDEGTVAEAGKHEQLLAAEGVYARLYREQFRKEMVRQP